MKTVGNTKSHGRFLQVRTLDQTDGGHSVMMICEGGNVRFQMNFTPNEARELAGHLQDEAKNCEVKTKESDGSGV
jgi:hypothetical protein